MSASLTDSKPEASAASCPVSDHRPEARNNLNTTPITSSARRKVLLQGSLLPAAAKQACGYQQKNPMWHDVTVRLGVRCTHSYNFWRPPADLQAPSLAGALTGTDLSQQPEGTIHIPEGVCLYQASKVVLHLAFNLKHRWSLKSQ
jgi:hypothetical protein